MGHEKVGMILEVKAWVVTIRGRGKSLDVISVDKHKDFFLAEDSREGSSGVVYKERRNSDMP